MRTVTLEKGTLEDSISATGTVQSAEVSNVTTDLKYTVKTVDVQVGDAVQAGDVICTLDTSDLEESIQKLQESLADAKATAQKQYEKAQTSLTEAEQNVTTAYDTMKEKESARDSADQTQRPAERPGRLAGAGRQRRRRRQPGGPRRHPRAHGGPGRRHIRPGGRRRHIRPRGDGPDRGPHRRTAGGKDRAGDGQRGIRGR